LLSRVPARSPAPELAAFTASPAASCLAFPLVREHHRSFQTVHDDAG
jgi:hypothetical protein